MQEKIKNYIEDGVHRLHLNLPNHISDSLLLFLSLLQKWNQHYNLTAIKDAYEIIVQHFFDSLALIPFLTTSYERLLDVGSGAGFPGIPLSLALPKKNFTLLDSRAKKTAFLKQVVMELNIQNIDVITSRAESYKTAPFDAIMCRAVGKISDILKMTRHLLAEKGAWFLMKGKYPEKELDELSSFYKYTVHPLQIPDLNAERNLVIVSFNHATS